MNNQLPYGKVSGDWSDKPLYIIGGGASLIGFDFSQLDGRLLGANKSAFAANCDVLCSLDQNFVRRTREEIQAFVANGKQAFLAMPSNERGHPPIDGVTYLLRVRENRLSDDKSRINGVNSGFACLGLAYHMGAREIALLGFDMGINESGQAHFHSGYEWHENKNHRMMQRWGKDFENASVQLDLKDVNVTNYIGPNGSNLEAFQKALLEDLI